MTSGRSPTDKPRAPTFVRNVGGERSFLARYVRYMKDQETARVYDWFCALWCISAVMGRWSYIARPRAPVYLNLYLILSAESGITRKSSSISIATRIVRDTCTAASVDARLVESSITHSALLQQMSHDSAVKNHTHVIFSISELAAVLGRGTAAVGMPALITDLYDCPTQRTGGGTAGRGEYHLSNVYASFIAGTTPSWLASSVSTSLVEGGFTSRCLFVASEKPKALIAWPNEGSNAFGYQEMVEQLSSILDRCPKQIGINAPALDIFKTWYKSRHRYYDPYRSSFASREDAHVLRIAGLLCISDEIFEIQSSHIRTAIEAVTWCREIGSEIFPPPDIGGAGASNIGASSNLITAIDRLKHYLVSNSSIGVFQSGIYTYMRRYLTVSQIRTIMDIMHELKMVQRFELSQHHVGRHAELWRATKHIVSKDFNDLLLQRLTTPASPKTSTVDITIGDELVDIANHSVDATDVVKGTGG